MVAVQPDLTILDRGGQTVAIVEVKNRVSTRPAFASQIRRNLMAHGQRDPKYFLLIFRDFGYVWKNEGLTDAPPTMRFSMKPIIARYKGPDVTEIGSLQLEATVLQWLNDLLSGRKKPTLSSERRLRELGFIADAQGASLLLAN